LGDYFFCFQDARTHSAKIRNWVLSGILKIPIFIFALAAVFLIWCWWGRFVWSSWRFVENYHNLIKFIGDFDQYLCVLEAWVVLQHTTQSRQPSHLGQTVANRWQAAIEIVKLETRLNKFPAKFPEIDLPVPRCCSPRPQRHPHFPAHRQQGAAPKTAAILNFINKQNMSDNATTCTWYI
jgi:hypothetical protein